MEPISPYMGVSTERQSRKWRYITLTIATVGLLLFTGLFVASNLRASTEDLAKRALNQDATFSDADYLLVIPKHFYQKNKSSTFAQKMTNGSDDVVVCRVNDRQFSELKSIKQADAGRFDYEGHEVEYVRINKDNDLQSIENALAATSSELNQLYCRQLDTNRIFFFDLPVHMS